VSWAPSQPLMSLFTRPATYLRTPQRCARTQIINFIYYVARQDPPISRLHPRRSFPQQSQSLTMVVLKFVSTAVALVSLFSFSQLVAGRPHQFGAHNNHGGHTRTVTEYSTRYVRSTQITTISPDAATVQQPTVQPTDQPTVQPAVQTNSKIHTKQHTTLTTIQQPQSGGPSAPSSFTISVEPSHTTTGSSPVETNTKYPAASYSVLKSYCNGGSFFDEFNFFTGEDPTNGFVQ
jgi:hypothetical protein